MSFRRRVNALTVSVFHQQLYATKDDMGNWLDAYAQIMGLEVLTSTTIKRPTWHPSKKQWSVTIARTQDGVVTEREPFYFSPIHLSMLSWHVNV